MSDRRRRRRVAVSRNATSGPGRGRPTQNQVHHHHTKDRRAGAKSPAKRPTFGVDSAGQRYKRVERNGVGVWVSLVADPYEARRAVRVMTNLLGSSRRSIWGAL
jgi:hypothetical protein